MRKFISIMLITVLMLSCMAMTASATEYKAGDEVTIAFTSANTGYACYDAVINYDKDALTLTAINGGSIYPDGSSFYGFTGTGKVTFAALNNVTTGGTLFTATFVVTDKAVEGQTYSVSAAVVSGSVADENDVDASLSISGGSITIYKAPCEHKNTEIINKKDATCGAAGYTGDTYCNDCKTTIATGSEIPATGDHKNVVTDAAVDPSCGKTGLTEGSHCADCGKTIVEQNTVPAKGHSYEISGAKEATCTEEGYTGDKHCTVCGDDEKGTTIPATGHQNTETRDAKEANCSEEGYTGDTWCKDCEQKIKDGKVIPTNGEHKVEKWTKYDDKTHVGECSRCGEPMEENHVWDNGGTSCIKCEYQKPGTKVDKDLDDVPKTGDITPMIVGAVVIFIAMAGAVVVIGKRKFVR